MMAEIVNLNRVRKAKAKVGAAMAAEINRAKFGRTKAERDAEAAEQARRNALLDGAKRKE
jgi:Arc/MetJ family transcription regulator